MTIFLNENYMDIDLMLHALCIKSFKLRSFVHVEKFDAEKLCY